MPVVVIVAGTPLGPPGDVHRRREVGRRIVAGIREVEDLEVGDLCVLHEVAARGADREQVNANRVSSEELTGVFTTTFEPPMSMIVTVMKLGLPSSGQEHGGACRDGGRQRRCDRDRPA